MEHGVTAKSKIWGIAAEFDSPEDILEAARKCREAGYTRMDANTPMPLEGMSEALGIRDKIMPTLMLIAGLTGASLGYFMQWYSFTQSYPLNIGGKPFHSWPQMIVITFESTILLTALTGVFGMIIINGLPMPYHPMFNTPNFEAASQDRFFLSIESRDPKFDPEATRALLQSLGAVNVSEVER
jgi:hypothetical protein